MTAEHQRLAVNATKEIPLVQWGPYLSERQWGTVREDYGPWGDAWNYFPFDHAHSRTYLWGEDGLAQRSTPSSIATRAAASIGVVAA